MSDVQDAARLVEAVALSSRGYDAKIHDARSASMATTATMLHEAGAFAFSVTKSFSVAMVSICEGLYHALTAKATAREVVQPFIIAGPLHGAIWSLLTSTPASVAIWDVVRQNSALFQIFGASSIHGVGHGALMRSMKLLLPTCLAVHEAYLWLPHHDCELTKDVIRFAEEQCRAGPNGSVLPCFDGLWHSVWESQRIRTHFDWTWLCGSAINSFWCLICRGYIAAYDGAYTNWVGHISTLRECVTALDVESERQRLGCIAAVSYTSFAPYDEAFVLAWAGAKRPTSCRGGRWVRKATARFGVADDLLDADDRAAASLSDDQAAVAPLATLTYWCKKVILSPVHDCNTIVPRDAACAVFSALNMASQGIDRGLCKRTCAQLYTLESACSNSSQRVVDACQGACDPFSQYAVSKYFAHYAGLLKHGHHYIM